jgi:hypothetical protein
MDRVFSVDEIPDHLWSPQIHVSGGGAEQSSSNMSRSASEWAFQRFLQEAATSPFSSSVADDNVVDTAPLPTKDDAAVLNNGPPPPHPPPPVTVDSEEYRRAVLKSKLSLACAAVAMTRVFFTFPLFVITM